MDNKKEISQVQYLLINNNHEYGINTYYFKVAQNASPLNEAFLSAVREYYESPEGQKLPREISRRFGWNNVIESIPASLWEKHGLIPFDGEKYCLLDFDDIDGAPFIDEW
jgi:hypothetical protein